MGNLRRWVFAHTALPSPVTVGVQGSLLRPWCWLRHQSPVGVQGSLCVLGAGVPSLSHECVGGSWLTVGRSRHQSPTGVHGTIVHGAGTRPMVAIHGCRVAVTRAPNVALRVSTCEFLHAVPAYRRAQAR